MRAGSFMTAYHRAMELSRRDSPTERAFACLGFPASRLSVENEVPHSAQVVEAGRLAHLTESFRHEGREPPFYIHREPIVQRFEPAHRGRRAWPCRESCVPQLHISYDSRSRYTSVARLVSAPAWHGRFLRARQS